MSSHVVNGTVRAALSDILEPVTFEIEFLKKKQTHVPPDRHWDIAQSAECSVVQADTLTYTSTPSGLRDLQVVSEDKYYTA